MRNEHPRPDFIRNDFISLNGEWQFEAAPSLQPEARYFADALTGRIEVPFAPGTNLSGAVLSCGTQSVWYKKEFVLSPSRIGNNVILNFGGINFQADIYVNGTGIATHKGGYTPFSLNITEYVKTGKNEIIVNAKETNSCPTGYNCESGFSLIGIWQSVWLEFAKEVYVLNAAASPDAANNRIIVSGILNLEFEGVINLSVSKNGVTEAEYKYKARKNFVLNAPLKSQAELWDILKGNLYDIKITLINKNAEITDAVQIYTAFRTFMFCGKSFRLNDKPIIIRAVKDGGYYADGALTAPSVDIIKQDLVKVAAMGFNCVMLTQKVPEPFYLYLADKLGLTVIMTYPKTYISKEREKDFINEWAEVVYRDFRHPCIAIWCPLIDYNGEADIVKKLYEVTISQIPGALFVDSAGGQHILTCANTKNVYSEGNAYLDEVFSLSNGAYRDGKKLNKERPYLMPLEELEKLPYIVTGYTAGNPSDKNFIKKALAKTAAALSGGASGYVYDILSDVPGNENGIYNAEGDFKAGRRVYAEFAAINDICPPD